MRDFPDMESDEDDDLMDLKESKPKIPWDIALTRQQSGRQYGSPNNRDRQDSVDLFSAASEGTSDTYSSDAGGDEDTFSRRKEGDLNGPAKKDTKYEPLTAAHVRAVLKDSIIMESFHENSVYKVPYDSVFNYVPLSQKTAGSSRLGTKLTLLDEQVNASILSVLGVEEDDVARVHEMLMVYTLGVHELLKDVRHASNTPKETVSSIAKMLCFLLSQVHPDGCDYETELTRIELANWQKFKDLLTQRETSLVGLLVEEREKLNDVKGLNFRLKKIQMKKQQQDEKRLGISEELNFQIQQINKEEKEIDYLTDATRKLKSQFNIARERYMMVGEDIRTQANIIYDVRYLISQMSAKYRDLTVRNLARSNLVKERDKVNSNETDTIKALREQKHNMEEDYATKLSERGQHRSQLGDLQSRLAWHATYIIALIRKRERVAYKLESVRNKAAYWDKTEEETTIILNGTTAQFNKAKEQRRQLQAKLDALNNRILEMKEETEALHRTIKRAEETAQEELKLRKEMKVQLAEQSRLLVEQHEKTDQLVAKLEEINNGNKLLDESNKSLEERRIECEKNIASKQEMKEKIEQKVTLVTEDIAVLNAEIKEQVAIKRKTEDECEDKEEASQTIVNEHKKVLKKWASELNEVKLDIMTTTSKLKATKSNTQKAYDEVNSIKRGIEATTKADDKLKKRIVLEKSDFVRSQGRLTSARETETSLLAHNEGLKRDLANLIGGEEKKIRNIEGQTATSRESVMKLIQISGELIAKNTSSSLMHKTAMKRSKKSQLALESESQKAISYARREVQKYRDMHMHALNDVSVHEAELAGIEKKNSALKVSVFNLRAARETTERLMNDLDREVEFKEEAIRSTQIEIEQLKEETDREKKAQKEREGVVQKLKRAHKAMFRDLLDLEDHAADYHYLNKQIDPAKTKSCSTMTEWIFINKESQTKLKLIGGGNGRRSSVHGGSQTDR